MYVKLNTINVVYVKRVGDGVSDIPLVQGIAVSLFLAHKQVQNSHYVDVRSAPAILPSQSIIRDDSRFSVTVGTKAASNQTNFMHARQGKAPIFKTLFKLLYP